MLNLWAVHHDPRIWDEPWKFNPNRFLDASGNPVSNDHVLRKRFNVKSMMFTCGCQLLFLPAFFLSEPGGACVLGKVWPEKGCFCLPRSCCEISHFCHRSRHLQLVTPVTLTLASSWNQSHFKSERNLGKCRKAMNNKLTEDMEHV